MASLTGKICRANRTIESRGCVGASRTYSARPTPRPMAAATEGA